MRVQASLAVVIVVFVGAPDRFEVVDVEVHINCVLFDQLDAEFSTVVSESTKLPIFTIVGPIWRLAKLRLIFVGVIELFESIMGVFAFVTIRAFP